ncbi:hypothetical protein [Lactiplantibacillus paraxiangfangensis]|uniref:hypothetical protein n=1 Tax=Lactiplantibacillus paraxiangfangensis TaxID=3076224 RepID=UPI0030C691C4
MAKSGLEITNQDLLSVLKEWVPQIKLSDVDKIKIVSLAKDKHKTVQITIEGETEVRDGMAVLETGDTIGITVQH